jgi:hypothetical protein
MKAPSSKERDAITERLAYLLEADESGWYEAASWLAGRASENGIDLYARYESSKAWATSVVERLRSSIDMEQFADGISSLDDFDTAEELSWKIFPDWKRSGL